MSTKERFAIRSYTNPSGEKVWRIQGRMPDGRRLRENKKDYAAAVGRRAELEIEALNIRIAVSLKKTRLTDDQLAEAESVFTNHPQLLRVRLTRIVDEYFQHHPIPITDTTVTDASAEFITKKTEKKLRPRTLEDYESRLSRLQDKFGNRTVNSLTSAELDPLITRPGNSAYTTNGNRRVLHTFFSWCVKKKYISANPVSDIEKAEIDDKEPGILNLSEVKSLLRTAASCKNGKLLPYVVLAVFSALRPKELTRLQWDQIDLKQKLIRVDGLVAKRRKRRIVELHDNTVDWLQGCQAKPIAPKNWRRDFDALRRLAGFRGSYPRQGDEALKPWPQDVIRHTAISFHYAFHENEHKTAKWAGHLPDVLHQHYKGLVSPDDAKEFWAMKPNDLDARIVPMPGVA